MVGADYYISTENSNQLIHLQYSDWNVAQCADQSRISYLKHWGPFWTRLYRREFLVDNDLYFPEGLFYEDTWFKLMSALYCESLKRVDGAFYHYFQSQDSTVRRRNDPRQYERIVIAEKIWDDCVQRKLFEKNQVLIEFKYLLVMSSNISYFLTKFDTPSIEQLENIKNFVHRRMPNYKKTEAYQNLSPGFKKLLNLTMLSPKLTIFIHRYHLNDLRLFCSSVKNKLRGYIGEND